MSRALRQGEGFAVPVECLEFSYIAEPCARIIVVRNRYLAPADFLDRIARHDAAHCLGNQLSAEAMSQQRNVFGYGIADQCLEFRYPRQVVVDAHRPAHEDQPRIGRCACWNGIARIDRDQMPRDLPLIEKFGEVAWTFGGSVRKIAMGFISCRGVWQYAPPLV